MLSDTLRLKSFDKNIYYEFKNILTRAENRDAEINESTVQDFLEQHTAFIPRPFMLNHQLHFNIFLSKFPIGSKFCDFAYLTKSSVEWWVVLMELENPLKKLFKGNEVSAKFTADFENACSQIRDWKIYIEEHRQEVLHSLRRIRVPLAENKVSFKYVVIMGRRAEIENSEARRKAIAINNSNDFRILNYDTLLTDYQRMTPEESLVLTHYDIDRFKIKYLPKDGSYKIKNRISTQMFSYLKPEDLQVSDEYIKVLKADGYEMDSWLKGELLTHNDRFTKQGFIDSLPKESPARMLLEGMRVNLI